MKRRDFLQTGMFGGFLSLVDILRLRAERPGGASKPARSVIMIVLPGGPSQIDTFDPKPNAPEGIRGEYRPIRTRVPGINVCELLPRHAEVMGRLAVVRSVVDVDFGEHTDSQLMTGMLVSQNQLRRPSIGAVISKLRGTSRRGVPPFVSLQAGSKGEGPGFLGITHQAFNPGANGMALLQPPEGAEAGRLAERRALLRVMDGKGSDAFQDQAFDLLTSGAVRTALDLNQESEQVRVRYGRGLQLLTALRLAQSGVACVTATLGTDPNNQAVGLWDTHSRNFDVLDRLLPEMDQAFAALVEDLHERGLDKEVLVLMWGEMGRTPRINPQAGRDHWARVMSCALTGGGLKTGQVVGATDAWGAEAKERPYRVQNVLATVYHALGIDSGTELTERIGRPIRLLDDPRPIEELI
jgi:hypothetical protein